jgi:hypothetical protein
MPGTVTRRLDKPDFDKLIEKEGGWDDAMPYTLHPFTFSADLKDANPGAGIWLLFLDVAEPCFYPDPKAKKTWVIIPEYMSIDELNFEFWQGVYPTKVRDIWGYEIAVTDPATLRGDDWDDRDLKGLWRFTHEYEFAPDGVPKFELGKVSTH